MSLDLIILAIFLAAASGLPGLCLPRKTVWGQRIAVGMMSSSSLLGLVGASLALVVDLSQTVSFPWPAIGNSIVGIDSLSAFFLVPIFFTSGLGSIYGLGYWPQLRHLRNGRKLQLFWGLLTAGMALLVISKHAMAFLFGWEVMALSAFFLVATEDHKAESCQASWIYIIATHIGTLTLFALFSLWRWSTGSYDLTPVAGDAIGIGVMNVLFFLSLFGFGLKAGVMPLHFWLPGAHASAPSHVSAMLSGIVLKMGIYGLVRFLSLLPDPPYMWGGLILLLGATSGLLGVVFAISQHDLKRLLAYHSVENIGIILMGLGLAMLGRSASRPEWVVLGMAGCLLHTWNHSLFKSLLFLSAGSVVHSVRTRHIDSLGGLAKTMPWTAAMFVIGAVAICGLPPLNGFVSELFVYLGLLGTMTTDGAMGSAAVIVVPVLAMIGALAVACFVKVYGAVFLGTARTPAATHAHESTLAMRWPMIVLAASCAIIGLAPVLLIPLLDRVISGWMIVPNSSLMSIGDVAPLKAISFMSVVLIVLVLSIATAIKLHNRVSRGIGTWDCGYARPTSRIQYTASSFAQMIVAMFRQVLRPRMHRPRIEGLFPEPAKMHSHVDDIILDRVMMPISRSLENWFGWFRRFQQGITQHYLLYILIT
ncbi:MAG: proton-conducting transporter membrane subunit, partial [Sedimentisphaerales bacterium]|nr:proton-conducting transporter membrane subunit [Sedimentisphaerales bacterium]